MSHLIMVIRHAEKPRPGGDETAVDDRGVADPAGLSVRGWQRAGALVPYFASRTSSSRQPGIAPPAAIFAAASHGRTRRPALTVAPLAAALQVQVQAEHRSDGGEDEVIRRSLAADGAVLICWRHEQIPVLAGALGVAEAASRRWDDDCYDEVWVFARDDDLGWRWSVQRQSLLAGDA
jgi:hypothetical protein